MIDAREQVMAWSREGALAPADLEAALQIAGVVPDVQAWRTFVMRLPVWLGAVLLASAAAYFVAANWQALGRYGKFALVESALVATVAVACWRGLDDLVGRAALFAAAMVAGVLLALVGQAYQTGADTYELFAVWALFVLPWAIVGRQPALWMLVVVLVDVAIVFYFRTSVARGLTSFDLAFTSNVALWCLTAVNAAALVVWEVAAWWRGGWWSVRWAPRLLATAVGVALAFFAIQYVVGWSGKAGVEGLIGYAAFAGAMYWAYRVRTVDLFMLSGLVLTAIAVGAVVLTDWMVPGGGMLAFLLVGMFILACAGGAAHWLRGLPTNAPEVAHDP